MLCVEYLFRVLNVVGEKTDFYFVDDIIPRCRDTKLTHIYFVDDIILCCKGEFKSIFLVIQEFNLFSANHWVES